ncbi:unnamed protein product, partial [marine sediment metagenome]
MGFPPQGIIAPPAAEVNYPEVDTYADLPDAAESANETFLVLTATGVFGTDRKRAGLWRSNGTAWYRLGTLAGSGRVVVSTPPSGYHELYNLYLGQLR